MATEKYLARVCWNSIGWKFPSGEAARIEKKTYVAKTGFGHEEWLFQYSCIIDGYHYSFLQPVNRSFDKVSKQTIDVTLYTIGPLRCRLYVARIKKCEVLTPDLAVDALNHYRSSGWLTKMKKQIEAIDGDADSIGEDAISMFNVRFLPKQVDLFRPLAVAKPADPIQRVNYYTLISANVNRLRQVKSARRRRKGTRIPPADRIVLRAGQPGTTFQLKQPPMQRQLFKLLEAEIGAGKVKMEDSYVDITAEGRSTRVLIEIKTEPTARFAIRQSLGQLLEYAYFEPLSEKRRLELVIVGPGAAETADDLYVKRLRQKFKIPISYCQFSEKGKLPEIFRRILYDRP